MGVSHGVVRHTYLSPINYHLPLFLACSYSNGPHTRMGMTVGVAVGVVRGSLPSTT